MTPRAWTALILGFIVIAALLALTAVTLISQRQRTVLLNKQLGALLNQTTQVLERAGPALDALPPQSSTIASRARSAADLVSEARPLVSALSASGLPNTVSTAGQLLQSIDQPGALAHTLANVDELTTRANRADLISRALGSFDDLATLVSLQRSLVSLQRTLVSLQTHTLAVQEDTLQTSRRTRRLTADTNAAARRTLAVVEAILAVAKQTLTHTANIDRKTGPAPPTSGTLP